MCYSNNYFAINLITNLQKYFNLFNQMIAKPYLQSLALQQLFFAKQKNNVFSAFALFFKVLLIFDFVKHCKIMLAIASNC